MKKRIYLLVALFGVVAFGFDVQAKSLKFGTVAPDQTPWAEELKVIQARVKKESQGKLEIKTYLGGQLGGEIEILQGLRRGRIQGGGLTAAALASAVPELDVLEIPYLFESNEEADYVLDNILFDPFKKLFEAKGLILVSWAENGWRDLATKSKEVRTPAELKGVKIRSQESKSHLAMWKKLGANPVPIAITEVLPSLQTGLVDGFDNTPLFTLAAELHTAVKYYTVTQHIYQPAAIVYSQVSWKELSPEEQKIVLGPGNAQAPAARKGVRALSEQLVTVLKESGIKVITLTAQERAQFQNQLKGVESEILQQIGPEAKKIYDLILEGKKQFQSKTKSQGTVKK